jgi:hypothetical protein
MNSDRNYGTYRRRGHRLRSGAGGGAVLIALGLILLAWTQDLIKIDLRSFWPDMDLERIWPWFNWGLAWPVFLLIPGVLLLAGGMVSGDPQARAGRIRNGIVFLTLSAFFFASSWGLIATALWPLLLVAAGGLMLLRSRAGHYAAW